MELTCDMSLAICKVQRWETETLKYFLSIIIMQTHKRACVIFLTIKL